MKNIIIIIILVSVSIGIAAQSKMGGNVAQYIGIGEPKYDFESYDEQTGDFELTEITKYEEDPGMFVRMILYVIDTVLNHQIDTLVAAYLE
ncbi:MAG: hypothetical protein GF384_05920, partial [Elusimicrobia bacterium]|nr:hypothetical protein [Elusimicrobiota bacterium]MBD3412289.1 hypothetical protein [Elusimicrobiota bacterium]